jgi:hypothetical protein
MKKKEAEIIRSQNKKFGGIEFNKTVIMETQFFGT